MRTLMIDTRQQVGKHTIKDKYFESVGVPIVRSKLPVGDYGCMQNMSVVVDTKKDIQELVSDICGKQHERFRRELELAQDNGIKLYVIVENRGKYIDKKQTVYTPTIKSLDELNKWENPRLFISRNGKQLFPTATRGITLQKACHTMQEKYGVTFLFCTPEESGKKILDILGVNRDEES